MDNKQALKLGCGLIALAFLLSILINLVQSAANTSYGLIVLFLAITLLSVGVAIWFKRAIKRLRSAMERESRLRKLENRGLDLDPEEVKEVVSRSADDWVARETESMKIREANALAREMRCRELEGNIVPLSPREEKLLIERTSAEWVERERVASESAERIRDAHIKNRIEQDKKKREEQEADRAVKEAARQYQRELTKAAELAEKQRIKEESRLRDEAAAARKASEVVELTQDKSDFFESNRELVSRFLEIAYRKVTTLDEYGDENWELLDKELARCLNKIDSKNPNQSRNFRLSDSRWRRLEWLRERFKEFHAQRASSNQRLPIAEIATMKGEEFESYIGQILKSANYEEVSGTPRTGDQGADLIAKKDGRTIVIQAKRYNGPVGNKAVQEVIAAITYYKADEGWVITNARFTESARELANRSGVRLFDGHDLARISEVL